VTVTWNFGDGGTASAPIDQAVEHTYTGVSTGLMQIQASVDGDPLDVYNCLVPFEAHPYTMFVAIAGYDGVSTFTPGTYTDDASALLVVADEAVPTPTFDMTWFSAHTAVADAVFKGVLYVNVSFGLPGVDPGVKQRGQVFGVPLSSWLAGPMPSGAHTLTVTTHANLTPPDDWGSGSAPFTKT